MPNIIKRLFCKHKDQKCITNIYGDWILDWNCRSVWECKDCGKWIFEDELSKDCNIINFDIFKNIKNEK